MSLDELRVMGASGSQVEVERNSLLTYNPDEAEAFAWTSATANLAAGGTAILVTNVSTSKHLHIQRAYIYSDVHSAVLLTLPAYATFTGTAITGIPLNRSAISIAPAIAWGNETGNASDGVFARTSTTELDTGQYGEWIELNGIVKLGYRDSFAMDIVADSGAFYSMVLGYFHDN